MPGPTCTPYDVTPTAPSSAECDYCGDGEEWAEHYHELYVSRDGASSRTADDLAITLLDDTGDLTGDPAWGIDAQHYWSLAIQDGDMGCHWLPEGGDHAEMLQDDVLRAESALADMGMYVTWDDGYVIERVRDGDDI